MAAKPLTTEEKDFLKSVYLTFIIGTRAVRTCFDSLHPPANLVTHLATDKSTLKLLEEDRIISRAVWEKLYPRPGARPTSAEFDITTLICLLREMTPKVTAPRRGFDQLPDRADKSTGACLAIIKWYRNFLAHPDQVKLKTLPSKTFNDLFTRVEMAIQVLGKNQFSSEITAAKKLNIDNDIAEILDTIVNYEKQFNDLQEGVDKISSQTIHQQKEIKQLRGKFEELEIDQTEEKISHQQVNDQMSEIRSKLKLQIEALEKKVKEQKQLAATQTKHSKQIQKLEQETGSIKKTQDNQRKEMKELTDKHHTFTSRTEELEKKANEITEKTNKLEEIQTMQHESFQTIGQEQEEHRKEVKEWKENQQSMPINFLGYGGLDIYLKDLKRREIDEITLPESFVEIKEVTKGAEALRDNDIVILVGIKGSGKSTIGKAIIKKYCEGNPDYDMIQLSTTKKSDINYCDGLGFFRFSNQVVVFLDDLFGRVPSTYAFKEHLMLLKWVYEKQDGIKILCTVQAETKACVDHGDPLLISAKRINLHSAIYPIRDVLIKSKIDGERSDNIIRQIKETKVKERIGFPALLSIYMNQELGIELFINPGNVFMKYLSSLKEGSDHDKMYFVILIHVLMTGKVYETQNASDKESMCHIATTIFGNTLKFQNYYSSIESIIDEKEDGILMNKNVPFDPYYCFKNEITPDFIFQYYKEEAFKKDYTKEEFEKVLTSCSLNCIVSYFRPLTDTTDELLFCIDSSLYQSITSHIINIIQKDLKTSRVSDVIMSLKTLCMSPLIQDENFLMELLMACDQLRSSEFGQPHNLKLGFNKICSLKTFHFPSVLLHQACRQLSMMYGENVKVVKMILQKVRVSREENVEICETINKLVMFSMEELCKENIDEKDVLELMWNFIMDKEVDCQYNQFLMNAWRNQCPKTVIWLQENIKEPKWLQMEQCFLDICRFGGVHKASWIFDQNRKSEQNKISMYKVLNEALERSRHDHELLDNIWKLEERILEDYKQDEKLHANTSTENAKINIANMVMKIALEVHSTSTLFRWACDTFKPHTQYFDKTMRKKIEREKTEKQDVNSLLFLSN